LIHGERPYLCAVLRHRCCGFIKENDVSLFNAAMGALLGMTVFDL